MNLSTRVLLLTSVGLVAVPAAMGAHFRLVEPASWIVENERGDPQKAGPCGGDSKDKGTPSNAVTKAVGGSKIHLKVVETIYHPGHYRVALAVNSRNELPGDPQTAERYTDRGLYSVWGVIQSPPQLPVIADGLFPHYSRPSSPQTYEADIQLPNINCRKCTLQVLQFMADHVYNVPGGYSYHHCADLEITADAAKPLDRGWPEAAKTQ